MLGQDWTTDDRRGINFHGKFSDKVHDDETVSRPASQPSAPSVRKLAVGFTSKGSSFLFSLSLCVFEFCCNSCRRCYMYGSVECRLTGLLKTAMVVRHCGLSRLALVFPLLFPSLRCPAACVCLVEVARYGRARHDGIQDIFLLLATTMAPAPRPTLRSPFFVVSFARCQSQSL